VEQKEMKPTPKRLKALIKDEQQASNAYRKMGLPQIAKDESRHRRILQKELKKAEK
jgi:hypothetical protein